MPVVVRWLACPLSNHWTLVRIISSLAYMCADLTNVDIALLRESVFISVSQPVLVLQTVFFGPTVNSWLI